MSDEEGGAESSRDALLLHTYSMVQDIVSKADSY
jgi:hypothetical protein